MSPSSQPAQKANTCCALASFLTVMNLWESLTLSWSVLPSVPREWGVAGWSMSCQRISHKRLSLLWEGAALGLWLCCCCCWTFGAAATAGGAAPAAGQGDDASSSLGWLLSDKGPFHQSLEFTEAAERYQQGFSTRYKIYRWAMCAQLYVWFCGVFVCIWCCFQEL